MPCTEINLICEPAHPLSGDDTFEAVNRLLAEYLARSSEGLVDVRLDAPLAVPAIGGETGFGREWLAAIVDAADDAIISSTLDGRITSWNPAAARLFGYSQPEAIGKSLTLIIPAEGHEEAREMLSRIFAGERFEHGEATRVARDGRCVEVSLTLSPVTDRAGRVVGMSQIVRDIGARKQSERAARDADRRKDEFLATLSHELRNPLAPISSAVATLSQLEHADPVARMACAVIERQLQQLTRLVDDLLDVGRITAGAIELIQERFDLRELLNTAQASVLPAFADVGQSFRLVLPQDPLWVEADRTRLLQVFTNLLTNANKYTPDGGVIEVEGQRKGESILVSVRDSGIGISAEMLERVFDLFAQVDRSAQRTRGGLGIGLALSKRLLEAHGGRIEARSDGPGKGTEFILELPAR